MREPSRRPPSRLGDLVLLAAIGSMAAVAFSWAGRGEWWLAVGPASPIVIGLLWYWSRRADRARFVRAARVEAGLCPRCGYDLRESTKRCPECGRRIPYLILRRCSSSAAEDT